ncbi:7443_t:CDS:2 [Entrophospora sp. SA101]|nr:10608_t:CDS:2 [Entrophospora sp. SA101]CAJ0900886.1 7443_t:CDS:2 [Entrophospora sp. SA101]
MFSTTIRCALRTVVNKSCAVVAASSPQTQQQLMKRSVRTFSALGPRFSAKPGTVPSEVEQSTGLERLEILAKLDGVDIFDDNPLPVASFGTKTNPVIVKAVDTHRLVACTGNNTVWISVDKDHEFDRCTECGQVFKLKQAHFGPHGYE